jgi:hypothetical protein
MPVLRGIVKDDPERMSVSLAKFTNSMAKGHTIVATGAFVGSLIDGEHNGVAFRKRHHFRARLHARPLLSQHKFSTLEVRSRVRQQDSHLQRKNMLSVEILMETIVVSGAVLQQKRRWPLLSGRVATVKKLLMAIRETKVNPHALVPRISDRHQEWIDRCSQVLNQHRQWIRKIAIFALAEAMPCHDDVTPKILTAVCI